MFAQQLHKPSQPAFLISAKVVMDVPAQGNHFGNRNHSQCGVRNDISRVSHPKSRRFTQWAAQSGIFRCRAAGPRRVKQKEALSFHTNAARESHNSCCRGGAQEVQRLVTNQ